MLKNCSMMPMGASLPSHHLLGSCATLGLCIAALQYMAQNAICRARRDAQSIIKEFDCKLSFRARQSAQMSVYLCLACQHREVCPLVVSRHALERAFHCAELVPRCLQKHPFAATASSSTGGYLTWICAERRHRQEARGMLKPERPR